MTELQKRELEILKEFLKICTELNLTYYLVCGSALGAVKYKGFIPWDDDIDVALPRKDYEIFLKLAQELLPKWCFLQNHKTDSKFHLVGSKLRDSRTTYVEQMCEKLPINHGVFIDVFPLDGQWKNYKEYVLFRRAQKEVESRRRVHLIYNRLSPKNILSLRTNYYYWMNRIFKMYDNTQNVIAKYDKIISSYDVECSEIWCNHANSISSLEYAPREQYGNGIMMKFEGLDVRVPERYDEYLTQKYGNWRDDLPEEQKIGHHYAKVIDLARPYTDYIK